MKVKLKLQNSHSKSQIVWNIDEMLGGTITSSLYYFFIDLEHFANDASVTPILNRCSLKQVVNYLFEYYSNYLKALEILDKKQTLFLPLAFEDEYTVVLSISRKLDDLFEIKKMIYSYNSSLLLGSPFFYLFQEKKGLVPCSESVTIVEDRLKFIESLGDFLSRRASYIAQSQQICNSKYS
ncbi:MAG TPA: hypothetical protein ENK91_09615 [Bacteroidetes bacterium]|nr:hypothetical protein [Bacteroidota bacterium]